MNVIEILSRQTRDAYDWINRLVNSVPHEQWDGTPEIMESNISWQVGHLIVSFYYHSIRVTVGHQMDVLKSMPLKDYTDLFTFNTMPKQAAGKVPPQKLMEHLIFMQNKSLEIIQSLSEQDLESQLEPTQMPHPVAKNKFEALDWNIKHTMWHCGQLGILKRLVHERYDFGLKKVE